MKGFVVAMQRTPDRPAQVQRQSSVYLLSIWYCLAISLFSGLGAFGLVALVLTILRQGIAQVVTLAGVVGIAYALLSFLQWRSFRLIITPIGIEYHSPYYRLATTWDKIERIGIVNGWKRPVEGLILRQSPKAIPFWKNFFIIPSTSLELGKSIPVEIFALANWRESKVGCEIKLYAQRLFTTVSLDTQDTESQLVVP